MTQSRTNNGKIDHGALVAARYRVERSPRWPEVERAYLERHSHCVACARPGARVEVHHVFPFHVCVLLGRADLDLDERYLITLCTESDARGAGDHHLLVGHFDDWESMNLRVRQEAAGDLHGMSAAVLRASSMRRQLATGRPQPLSAMRPREQEQIRHALDSAMPLRGSRSTFRW